MPHPQVVSAVGEPIAGDAYGKSALLRAWGAAQVIWPLAAGAHHGSNNTSNGRNNFCISVQYM